MWLNITDSDDDDDDDGDDDDDDYDGSDSYDDNFTCRKHFSLYLCHLTLFRPTLSALAKCMRGNWKTSLKLQSRGR